jgi:lipoate-protein ligase A
VANWVKSKLSGEEITQEDLLKTAEEAFQKLTEKAKKGEMTLGEWAPPKSAVDEKVSKDIVK